MASFNSVTITVSTTSAATSGVYRLQSSISWPPVRKAYDRGIIHRDIKPANIILFWQPRTFEAKPKVAWPTLIRRFRGQRN